MKINNREPGDKNLSQLIRKCIKLAEQAVQKGNHPFGALLVLDEEIILTAENTVTTERDWTRHAELNLIRFAMQVHDAQILSRCTLYTSTEPCPMCSGAIYRVSIPRVVFGCSSETLGSITGRSPEATCRQIFAAGKRTVEVIGPVLEGEAAEIHRRFWKQGLR
jgi:tRNA(Arg) A34 adenosine deaminase TadA